MKPFRKAALAALLLACGLSGAQAQTIPAQTVPAEKRPTLILMISVDMLSGEIMDRYARDLPGGLGRILKEGVVFHNAYQEHAFTETCPGHSTLLSGRHPASTGIGQNLWFDSAQGKTIYCVSDEGARNFGEPSGNAGSSDKWFRGTTFGSWLKHQSPGARVFSVSGKDRAAIMMAGLDADGVFWFQEGFGITTSTAYRKAVPDYFLRYDRDLMERLRSESLVWTPLPGADSSQTLPGEWKDELNGKSIVSRLPRLIQTQGFPGSPKPGFLLGEQQDGSFWGRFRASPFSDTVTFDAAELLIRNEHLGEGSAPDLLCIGLSATNATEHAFGNAGPEIQDTIRRLDQRLGSFLDKLQSQGKRVVLVLSADHSGIDFSERLRDQGIPAKRLDTAKWMEDLQARIAKEFDTTRPLISGSHNPGGGNQQIYIDHAIAAEFGDMKAVTARILRIVRAMPEINVAATREELVALPDRHFADPRDEDVLYRLKFSAPEGRAGDILFAYNPLVLRDGPPKFDPAQHGTPWDYDRRVPIVFWGPWAAEQRNDPASTVDIAPTLAATLGIRPEEKLDGVVLKLTGK